MNVYRLSVLRPYWGLEVAETYGQLDLELFETGRKYGLQRNRLDVVMDAREPCQVTIAVGAPLAAADFTGSGEFEAGDLVLDDSESGYVPTHATLTARGLYEVGVAEGRSPEGLPVFSVVFTKL